MNRNRTSILVLLTLGALATFNAVSGAHDYPPAQWSVKCSHNNKTFELIFKSASGDVAEDDMSVSIKTTSGKIASLPIKPALYTSRGSVSEVKNLCADPKTGGLDSLVAFPISENTVLVWLSSDGRPFFNILSLVLVDIEQGKVLDYLDTKTAIKDVNNSRMLVTRKAKDGFQVRLIGEWLKDTGLDTAETAIEYWVSVKVQNGKILFTLPILR